jgi:hypothetical protein
LPEEANEGQENHVWGISRCKLLKGQSGISQRLPKENNKQKTSNISGRNKNKKNIQKYVKSCPPNFFCSVHHIKASKKLGYEIKSLHKIYLFSIFIRKT